MRNEEYTCFGNTNIDDFIKSQGWTWFSNIHGITSYLAEDTYYEDNKVYNFVVRSNNHFVKHRNGLKLYFNMGGYYVNTIFGRVYVNDIFDSNYTLPFKKSLKSQFWA